MNKEYEDIGKRLKEEAVGKYGSVAGLEKKLNRADKSLGQYTSGRNKPGQKLQNEFTSAGLDIKYIMTGKKKEEEQNFVIPTGHFFRVVMSIDAGDPVLIFKEENMTGEKVFFPFGSPETCFALKVVGNSMTCEGARSIQEGALALADLSENPLPGDVVAVSLTGGRQMIKQYMEGPEKEYVTLRSFNPDYPDIVVKKQEVHKMVRIIGISNFKRL